MQSVGTSTGNAGPSGEEALPTLSWPPETFDATSGDEDSLMGLANPGYV